MKEVSIIVCIIGVIVNFICMTTAINNKNIIAVYGWLTAVLWSLACLTRDLT
jgi:FtsH-binding integral membrane protein